MERENFTSIKEELLNPDSSTLESVAVVYAKVFAGWPWYEVSKGMNCEQFYGPEFPPGSLCPCGYENLVEAYPKEETIKYIKDELSKPLALGINLAVNGLQSGFGWGYKLSGKDFAEKKYSKTDSRIAIASVVGNKDYFYISEVGIVPSFQGSGLGFRITSRLAEQASFYSLPILMRTNIESPMVKIGKRLGMSIVFGPSTDFIDPENPKRVVFTKE